MELNSILLFFLAVIPLVCTPGPDIIFVASQGAMKGRLASLRAVAGVLAGYTVHAILSAMGVAFLVSSSPLLFALLKWLGVLYLLFLAMQILYSASRRKDGFGLHEQADNRASLWRGFFTSLLNPKGLLMYLAILPQFVSPEGDAARQVITLSLLFIISCGVVYSVVGLLAAKAHGHAISDRKRRTIEAVAGVMLVGAAIKLM